MGDLVDSITGGFTLKDVASAYVDIAKAKLNSNLSAQTSYIDQLRGTVSLLEQQNRAQLEAAQTSTFDFTTVAKWGLLVVVGYVVYKAVK